MYLRDIRFLKFYQNLFMS